MHCNKKMLFFGISPLYGSPIDPLLGSTFRYAVLTLESINYTVNTNLYCHGRPIET